MFRTLTSLRQLGYVVVDSSRGVLPLGFWQCARHAADTAASAASTLEVSASPLLRELDVNMPSSVKQLIPPLEKRKPDAHSLRTGLVGVKVGMVSEWDEYGKLTPYTILWFDENHVRLHLFVLVLRL